MTKVLKGKPVADKITKDLIEEVKFLKGKKIIPKLGIIRVGERSDDLAYEKGAVKRCEKIGIEVEVIKTNEDISQEDFIKQLEKINKDDEIHGILIFRPLPKHLDEDIIKYYIKPEKDIDCFSPINQGKLYEGNQSGFSPCTPVAIMEILKHYEINVAGKDCLVIGSSNVVGKPVSLLLLNQKATVTITHSRTKDVSKFSRDSDIIVSCAGVAKLVDEKYLGDNWPIIIDVGINIDEKGNMCGDVDYENIKEKTEMITPVPGGVGSVTTSILAKHIVRACRSVHNI